MCFNFLLLCAGGLLPLRLTGVVVSSSVSESASVSGMIKSMSSSSKTIIFVSGPVILAFAISTRVVFSTRDLETLVGSCGEGLDLLQRFKMCVAAGLKTCVTVGFKTMCNHSGGFLTQGCSRSAALSLLRGRCLFLNVLDNFVLNITFSRFSFCHLLAE